MTIEEIEKNFKDVEDDGFYNISGKSIIFLLSEVKKLRGGIQIILDSEYMNSLVIKDKLKKLLESTE